MAIQARVTSIRVSGTYPPSPVSAASITAREADRFAARLEQYNRRQIEYEDFWSKTMGEHSGFMAHMLDREERLLISQGRKLEDAFLRGGPRNVGGDAVMKAAKAR